jgi:hypothetical protein
VRAMRAAQAASGRLSGSATGLWCVEDLMR